MATSRPGHQIDEARVRAVREIDETERAMIEGINSGSMLGGKSGESMAHNATQRAQYIRTLQENSAMFRAQANELAIAGSLEELTILTEGESLYERYTSLTTLRDGRSDFDQCLVQSLLK